MSTAWRALETLNGISAVVMMSVEWASGAPPSEWPVRMLAMAIFCHLWAEHR